MVSFLGMLFGGDDKYRITCPVCRRSGNMFVPGGRLEGIFEIGGKTPDGGLFIKDCPGCHWSLGYDTLTGRVYKIAENPKADTSDEILVSISQYILDEIIPAMDLLINKLKGHSMAEEQKYQLIRMTLAYLIPLTDVVAAHYAKNPETVKVTIEKIKENFKRVFDSEGKLLDNLLSKSSEEGMTEIIALLSIVLDIDPMNEEHFSQFSQSMKQKIGYEAKINYGLLIKRILSE